MVIGLHCVRTTKKACMHTVFFNSLTTKIGESDTIGALLLQHWVRPSADKVQHVIQDEKKLPSIMENIESLQGILRIFFVSLSLNFRIDSFGREQMDKALV